MPLPRSHGQRKPQQPRSVHTPMEGSIPPQEPKHYDTTVRAPASRSAHMRRALATHRQGMQHVDPTCSQPLPQASSIAWLPPSQKLSRGAGFRSCSFEPSTAQQAPPWAAPPHSLHLKMITDVQRFPSTNLVGQLHEGRQLTASCAVSTKERPQQAHVIAARAAIDLLR